MKFAEYRGMKVLKLLDPRRRKALSLWRKAVLCAYAADTVDARFGEENIWLCRKTAAYIYRDFTSLGIRYTRGSRPHLEKIAAAVTHGCRTDRARVVALLRRVRDLHKRHTGPYKDVFHGGTEEDVIKKGSNMCNEMARVFACLCQICGMPSRFIGHPLGGHGVNEVYLEGKWGYFDIRGKYFENADGSLANAWELMQDPTIIDRQPARVRKDLAKAKNVLRTRDVYFHPDEITTVANYPIDNCGRYSYDWTWNTSELRCRIAAIKKPLRKLTRELFGQ